jgi:predicted kinase
VSRGNKRQDLAPKAYECINPDEFLQTSSGRHWTPERNKAAWQLAFAALQRALMENSSGQDSSGKRDLYVVCGIQGAGKTTWIRENALRLAPCIFFDAALPRAIHRLPLITMAQQVGVTVHAVWINSPIEDALKRNALRSADERVPEASIHAVAEQFEALTCAEGFAAIINVGADDAHADGP